MLYSLVCYSVENLSNINQLENKKKQIASIIFKDMSKQLRLINDHIHQGIRCRKSSQVRKCDGYQKTKYLTSNMNPFLLWELHLGRGTLNFRPWNNVIRIQSLLVQKIQWEKLHFLLFIQPKERGTECNFWVILCNTQKINLAIFLPRIMYEKAYHRVSAFWFMKRI